MSYSLGPILRDIFIRYQTVRNQESLEKKIKAARWQTKSWLSLFKKNKMKKVIFITFDPDDGHVQAAIEDRTMSTEFCQKEGYRLLSLHELEWDCLLNNYNEKVAVMVDVEE